MENVTRLLFLGTAAADFSPRLKTDCRDRFDRDVRRSSCMLIGDHILVDCGPHTPDSMRIAGKDPALITDVFLTHLHADHFMPENIARIAQGREKPLRLWVRRDAVLPEIPGTETVRIPLNRAVRVSETMTVESLDANHDPSVFPQHLLFTIGSKTLFYGLDGGWFLTASWNALRGRNLDLLVLDATCGDYTGDYRAAEHNSLPMLRLLLPSMRTWGMIGERSRIFLSHLAPSLHLSHAQTAEIAAGDGLIVAYDGLETVL